MTAWKEWIDRTGRRFPWYRRLLDEQVGRSGGGTAAGLSQERLPLLTASLLEAHYYTEANPLAQRADHRRYRTSGTSTGRRKTIYYSERDEEAYLRIKREVFRAILGPIDYRTAVSDLGTGHAEATAAEVFRGLGMTAHTLPFRLPIEGHIEALARIRPEVLYTMPSILDRILQTAEDPAAFGIRQVILVGETASRAWCSRVAERLDIAPERIADTYGSIEIGTIAYYAHEHGRYLFADGIVAEGIGVEELGEAYEPLAGESERVLVLSSTAREAFPALRYVTYDVVRDLRPILAGGELRMSFRNVARRIGPELKHGEKISIYDIEDAVYRHLREAAVRVRVLGRCLRVCLQSPAPIGEENLSRIRRQIEDAVPEIGQMIRGGLLAGIEVVQEATDDTLDGDIVKRKKIFYA
nr:CoF synthetase [Cohnella sp. REN36]